MRLVLLTPQKTLFDGKVDSVTIPGTKGLFTVLSQHAPLITTLEQGTLSYKIEGVEHKILIDNGFAEVLNDDVSICIEKYTEFTK
jgi:F-type H+-transporting ATPase subunit epsilon